MLWVLIRIASPGYSLESPRRGKSNEYPQHIFLWRTTENYPLIITKYPPYLLLCAHVCLKMHLLYKSKVPFLGAAKFGSWKMEKNQGFGIPKSRKLIILEKNSSGRQHRLYNIPQHAEG